MGAPGFRVLEGSMVITVLNVAEKPSVAKGITGILSGGRSRTIESYSPTNKVFEFDCTLGREQCHMYVTSVRGHLMELDFVEQFRNWKSCEPAFLFDAPVVKYVPEDKIPMKRTLLEYARRCQWLVLWLDCDREGENIAYEVLEVCTSSNNALVVRRARFSAVVEREIRHAADNLVAPNPLQASAVDARQEIDLRIGSAFTRFQTMLLKKRFVLPFEPHEKVVLSYGPCQFPTLGFVVERYWQVQAHQPEDFWTINCFYKSGNDTASFKWLRGHLFDYLAAVVIYEMCVEEPTATVFSVTGSEQRKYPPHPLSTTELMKRASRFLHMSSVQSMKIAEELYQQGFISYPRTETDFFSENANLRQMVEDQTRHPVWGNYAHRLLDPQENLWRHPSNGGHDDKAHPPIHPTKFSDGEPQWRNEHRAVYELVVRHFLACVSQPAIGYGTKAMVDIAGEQFIASGLMVTARNYLDIYRYESWSGSTLPNFELGQQFVPNRLTLDAGRTQPPALLSESELIAMMAKANIGTDATMQEHIHKITERRYATKDPDTRFRPTTLGEALVMGYDAMGYELWKPNLRSKMEQDVTAISEGNKQKEQFLMTCLQQMKGTLVEATGRSQQLLETMALFFERTQYQGDEGFPVRRCPECQGADMVLRKRPDGKFMVGCRSYPQCRRVVWLPGCVLEATVTAQACNICTPGPVFKIYFKFRRAEIPPQYNTTHTGCVGGCDPMMNDIISMANWSSTGRGQAAPRNNAGRVNTAHQAPGRNTRNDNVNAFTNRQNLAPHAPAGSMNARNGNAIGNMNAFRQNPVAPTPGNAVIVCTCGEACIYLTSSTEANPDRKFYKCRANRCNYFVWEDELQNQDAGGARRVNRGGNAANARGRGRGRAARGGRARTRAQQQRGGMIARATGEVFYDAMAEF